MHLTTCAGTTGFLLGGAAGIIKGTSPFLFASASGIQTFALGTTFWATRSTIVEAWTPANHQLPAGDLTKASTISGGITGGAVALLMRGRANVLPGILMFSIFGFAGQVTSNWLARPRGITDGPPKQSFWRRMSEKAWSPVTVMSDEEYAKMLKEKMLRVDAQLSILDDRMAALRKVQEAQDVASSLPEE